MNNEIKKLVERLNEAYDKIERLEYRVVELENIVKKIDILVLKNYTIQ